jgi:DNA-binding LacI/PurR family transcriptional regulator
MGGSVAWAQSSSPNPGAQNSTVSGTQSGSGQYSPGASVSADTQQKIRQSLEQSGFKDIHVVPETFVVRAQAPDGSRIVMLLSPDQLTEMVMPSANQGQQGNSSQPFAGQSGYQSSYGNGLSTTRQQAQQELSRYGYTSVQDMTPMRGWVADANKNGEQVRVMLSDNGLVATFPGR